MPGRPWHLAVWGDAFVVSLQPCRDPFSCPLAGCPSPWAQCHQPESAFSLAATMRCHQHRRGGSRIPMWLYPSPGSSIRALSTALRTKSEPDIQGSPRLGACLSPGPRTLLAMWTLSTVRSSKGCDVSLLRTLSPHQPSAKLLHQSAPV